MFLLLEIVTMKNISDIICIIKLLFLFFCCGTIAKISIANIPAICAIITFIDKYQFYIHMELGKAI